jgi:ribosomal protein L12E/L44/L45/RPP1/RPP2
MENNQKPEWFELADNDQPVSRKSKSKVSASARSLTFILAGILVIPLGAGLALLTHKDQPAIATESLTLTQDSPAPTSSAQTLTSNTISTPIASESSPAAIAPPASSASNDIILPPTKKADDDDDDDDDEDEDEDEDDEDEDDEEDDD